MKPGEDLRLLNQVTNDHEFRQGAEILDSFPVTASIDVCNTCNLRCVFCPTGQGRIRSDHFMTADEFDRVIAEIGPYLDTLAFHNWGEPLLNRDVFTMVARAKKLGIRTALSTNLNHLTPAMAGEMIASGLDSLIVSLDGVNQATYAKYRVGGDFNRVIGNLKLLVEKKRAAKAATPEITWQYLVFRHTEGHRAEARRMQRQLGIDRIAFASAWIDDIEKNFDEWAPRDPELGRYRTNAGKTRLSRVPARCAAPWKTIAVDCEGNVFPCCAEIPKTHSFGNLLRKPFRKIWNAEPYRRARRIVAGGRPADPAIWCTRCRDNKYHLR